MQTKTISLGKTYNDGNYESTRIDITVDLVAGEDVATVFQAMLERMDNLRKAQRRHNRQTEE